MFCRFWLLAYVLVAVWLTKSSKFACPAEGAPVVVMTWRWAWTSAALEPLICRMNSCSDVIDGTRTGAPVRARGAGSLPEARWNEPAPGMFRSALPIQPSLKGGLRWPACQMSIDRKCDWFGFG